MGKNNPKPVRKAAGVKTSSVRTNSGKKLTVQSTKKDKMPRFAAEGKSYDKAGKELPNKEVFSMKNAKTTADTKKLIRKGGVPEGAVGRGKGNQQVGYKEGPSFKKKKP